MVGAAAVVDLYGVMSVAACDRAETYQWRCHPRFAVVVAMMR